MIIRTLLSIIVLIAGTVTAAGQESAKALLDPYLQIQQQLADDKIEGIKAPAQAIGKQAAGMVEKGAALAAAAKNVEAATDLKAAREAFGALSDAVIAATKGQDLGGVKLGFCPMAAKPWLQKESTVRNPYYGSAMLTCGELRDPKK